MLDWKELNRMFDGVPSKRSRRYELQMERKRYNPFYSGLMHYKRKRGLEKRLGASKRSWEDVSIDNRMKKTCKKLGVPFPW